MIITWLRRTARRLKRADVNADGQPRDQGELAAASLPWAEELTRILAKQPTAGEDPAEAQRAKMEAVMRTSAAWGWAMAQLGFKTAPAPQVVWDGDTPKINFGAGTSGHLRLRRDDQWHELGGVPPLPGPLPPHVISTERSSEDE